MKTAFKLVAALMLGVSCVPAQCERLRDLNQNSKKLNIMHFDAEKWQQSRRSCGLGIKGMVGDLVHHHLFGENREQIIQQLGPPDKQESEFIYSYALDSKKTASISRLTLEIRFNDKMVQSYRVAAHEPGPTDVPTSDWVNTVGKLETQTEMRVVGEPFNAVTWKAALNAGYADTRMLTEVLTKEIPVGTMRTKVVSLLGEPTKTLVNKSTTVDSYVVSSGKCTNAGYRSFDIRYDDQKLKKFRIAGHAQQSPISSSGDWMYH